MLVKICDRCGATLNKKEFYDFFISKYDQLGFRYNNQANLELCEDCYKELYAWLKKGRN